MSALVSTKFRAFIAEELKKQLLYIYKDTEFQAVTPGGINCINSKDSKDSSITF